MALDVKRLRRDVEARRLGRAADVGLGGARPSGAMALVRAHMGEIDAMRAEGAAWMDIAAALAEQGVQQRDGRPITGRRLTGLIDSIRRQDAGRAKAKAHRTARSDVAASMSSASERAPTSGSPQSHRPASNHFGPVAEHRSAEQIRRDNLAELDDILKGRTR